MMENYVCICWECRKIFDCDSGYDVLEWLKEHWGHDVEISKNEGEDVWRSKDHEP